jgi:hypothetical protein
LLKCVWTEWDSGPTIISQNWPLLEASLYLQVERRGRKNLPEDMSSSHSSENRAVSCNTYYGFTVSPKGLCVGNVIPKFIH